MILSPIFLRKRKNLLQLRLCNSTILIFNNRSIRLFSAEVSPDEKYERCVYVYVYIYMYVCMYACMYVYMNYFNYDYPTAIYVITIT
jgi:hypothetical protein